ncbi:MAG: hypothetical protein AAFQ67_07380, partial [Pseudomonadota bacterium]
MEASLLKSLFGAFAAVAFAQGSVAQTDANVEVASFEALSVDAAQRDIALARRTLESLHAGYDRYTDRAVLDGMWTALETKASDGLDTRDLYLELSRITAAIRCDHTKVQLSEAMETTRTTAPVYLPFRYRLFDNRMIVDQVANDVPLTRGDEILAIDG